jgi:hypothetical protein
MEDRGWKMVPGKEEPRIEDGRWRMEDRARKRQKKS